MPTQPSPVDEYVNDTTSCGLVGLILSSEAVTSATVLKVSFLTKVCPGGAGNPGEVFNEGVNVATSGEKSDLAFSSKAVETRSRESPYHLVKCS